MNLDLIAIITLLIIMSLLGIGILMILVIIGADQLKTPEEKEQEDIEQMEYLRKYNKKQLKK